MKNRFHLWFWLVLALVLRLYKISLIKCIAVDGVAYIDVAKEWITGIGFNPIWPPLYPWFINLFMRLGINPETCGQLVSVAFGVAAVALVYKMTSSIFSPVIANIATIFSVFHPYLVRYSAEVLSDSLFTFLVTAVVFCGWLLLQKNKISLAIVTGILAGLAYLTKPEGIFLLLIISIWVFAAGQGTILRIDTCPSRRHVGAGKYCGSCIPGHAPTTSWDCEKPARGISRCKDIWYKRLMLILCAWGIFFMISFPYVYAIREKTGKWMISQKETIVFSVALQEEGYASEFLNISPLEYAKENPKKFFMKIGNGLLSLLGRVPDAYHPLLFIFLVIGVISGIKEKRFLFYITTFLILFFIGYAVFHPGRRYLVGWVPLTLFLSAYGVAYMNKFVKNLSLREKTSGVNPGSSPVVNPGMRTRSGCRPVGTQKLGGAPWLPILITILIMLPKTMESVRDSAIKWKEAGLWIKANSTGIPSIVSKNCRVAFYAEGKEVSSGEKDCYIVTDEDNSLLKKIYHTSRGLNIYYAGN